MESQTVLKERPKREHDAASDRQGDEVLDITYYTDPLCCWSWAFEPQWRKLLYEYEGQIKYRYCMGGLLPGWNNYIDHLNSVSKPIQMGPVWMHAGQLSGIPIQHNVWMRDPPASSYLACIAVKCAGLQSQKAEELYLRLLREAIMIKGENIADPKVLLQEANNLSRWLPEFDTKQFEEDIKNDIGLEEFRKDLFEVQNRNVNRFPSLIIKNKNNQALIIAGHRPYNILLDAVGQLGIVKKTHEKINTESYRAYWPTITEREIAEVKADRNSTG